jgi:uncharacterized protein YjcR
VNRSGPRSYNRLKALEAKDLVAKNWPLAAIADKLDCSKTSVRRWAK